MYLVSKLNESHLAITKSDSISVNIPHSNKDIYLLAKKGYKKLANNNSLFTYKYSMAKNSLISVFQSYNGTSGYLNPFTGEAQVNRLIPKPFYLQPQLMKWLTKSVLLQKMKLIL